MSNRQQAKGIVLEYFAAMESGNSPKQALKQFSHKDYSFRGVHPFNDLEGASVVAENVWQPLEDSFTALQRRQDIFFAGPNLSNGDMWVTSMGKFMGLMDKAWLGIPPTGKIALLPYCEFHRIVDDKIAESALWVDIVSVMKQAGWNPLPKQTGAEIINPGPRTNDGLLFEPQDETESQRTLDLIMEMCNDLVGDDMHSGQDALTRTWHKDMTWFGPSGIGAAYTLSRYELQHQGPFHDGLENIEFSGHVLEHAEGNYGGWFGWPNLTMQQGNGFLGLPASPDGTRTEMRVVDIYRREGDKLAENWIFIDFLHYLKVLGLDVLERCQSIGKH